jgi:Ferritin-like domain
MDTRDMETRDTTPEAVELTPEIATSRLFESFGIRQPRRSMLKGVIAGAAGATGLALGASTLFVPSRTAHAQSASGGCDDSVKTILSVAATAERLAVTFYSHGLAHAEQLGLSWGSRAAIKAALVEEQIHELFFVANGGTPLASTFSFPHGDETFENLSVFIATQQQLEGVFDSAFLAAIKEFADMGLSGLAQIAGQIATVEAEHRALGRFIAGLVPADNWAFTPVLIPSVGAAPAIVKEAGYLSPRSGNSYTYHQVSTEDDGVVYREPFVAAC